MSTDWEAGQKLINVSDTIGDAIEELFGLVSNKKDTNDGT